MPGVYRRERRLLRHRRWIPTAALTGGGEIVGTSVVEHADSTDATSGATPSWDPVANTVYLAWVCQRNAAGEPLVPTASGNGITWTQVDTQLRSGASLRGTLFVGTSASPSSGAFTATFGETTGSWIILIDGYTGVDTASPIVQFKGANGGSAVSMVATLDAAVTAGNATAGHVGQNSGDSSLVTTGSGYTRLSENQISTPGHVGVTEWRADGSTTIDFTTSTNQWNLVGVELKAAAGAGGETADAITATATGAAGDVDAHVRTNAGLASGTGAALPGSARVGATSTATATATGAALTPATAVSGTLGAAAGSGAAGAPSPSVGARPGTAAGSGAAHDATVSTAVQTNANAEVATGTGAAHGASVRVQTNAGAAAGTGAAAGPSASVRATAATATASGAATAASDAVGATTATAAGSATAFGVFPRVGATTQAAAGTGAAINATVSTGSNVNAAAGLATGTGAALSPSAAVGSAAGVAGGTGSAASVAGSVTVTTTLAAGTGAAYNATFAIGELVSAGRPPRIVEAGGPAVSISFGGAPPSGTARDPSAKIVEAK